MRNYAELEGHLRSDLSLSLLSETMYLSDMSVQTAFAKAIADSFYKKLCPLGTSKEADAQALKKFLAINASISTDPFDFNATNEAESCFWDYFQNNFRATISPVLVFQGPGEDEQSETEHRHPDSGNPLQGVPNYDLAFIRERMGIGPGSAQLADSRTFATKLFSGPMSWTNSDYLITLYRSALSETGLWADAEMRRFEQFGFDNVDGGKLFFAKKNAEISRTCCTEANLNMLFQKSLGEFCEERLKWSFGISLETQAVYNAELARIGSIDGSFGTIDLVSASDSISLKLFDAIMPEGFTKALFMMSRSEVVTLPGNDKVSLSMISTMGNGFTFPLQTIIFACAVRAVYQLMGFPCVDPKKHFGVFGDDIVVRRETYVFLCRMLERLGFQVNVGKSFNDGPFRESCGKDYFRGVNIRGVYVRSLETPQEVCSLINRLTRWSARSGIWLTATIRLLKRWAYEAKAPLVPPSEQDDAGIHVPFRLTRPKVNDSYWFLYRAYKKRTRKMVMPEPDESPNPPGYGLSFLSGHTKRADTVNQNDNRLFGERPAVISLRDSIGVRSRFKVASRAIPYWDWPGLREDGDILRHQAWLALMLDNYSN